MSINYFNHFNLEEKYFISIPLLRKKYYEISRDLHPDLRSDQSNQSLNNIGIEEHNEAYKILLNPESRLFYLLKLNLLVPDDKTGPGQSFLFDMIQMNEIIDEAHETSDQEKIQALQNEVNQMIEQDQNQSEKFLRQFDNGDRSHQIIEEIQRYYYRLKYYKRLLQNLDRHESDQI